jgi:hypothetical protein
MSTPAVSLAQQIAAIRRSRETLEYSYTVRAGKDKGKITDTGIVHEVHALRAAETTLLAIQSPFKAVRHRKKK